MCVAAVQWTGVDAGDSECGLRGQAGLWIEPVLANALIAIVFTIGAIGRTVLSCRMWSSGGGGAPLPKTSMTYGCFSRSLHGSGRAISLSGIVPSERARLPENIIGPISLLAMVPTSFQEKALFQSGRRAGPVRAPISCVNDYVFFEERTRGAVCFQAMLLCFRQQTDSLHPFTGMVSTAPGFLVVFESSIRICSIVNPSLLGKSVSDI
ncbi:hypothetical protein MSKU15_0409 [Komagataeibacter diospyri]|nr:hypothetical protein MSKU15_0409 [Komagataeibacter diospyri]